MAAADRALGDPFPNAQVRTQSGYKDAQESELDTFLNVFVALLLLSEVIALLGIVNTLFLSVYERTREIGLLRAVGMSRRQVRRMVRGESVVITLIGCVLGVLIGLLWAWAVVSALSGQGIGVGGDPAARPGCCSSSSRRSPASSPRSSPRGARPGSTCSRRSRTSDGSTSPVAA